MSDIKAIGVIGLGKMGRGMAASLKRAGFQVTGLDANPELAARVALEEGINAAGTLAQLLADVQAVVLSLPNSAIVRSLVEGEEGIAALAPAGLLLIDTTTADPTVTQALAVVLQARGVRFVDAPVSGGPRGAQSGELTMFIGGAPADLGAAEPVLSALGTKRYVIGQVGAGHIAKLINNLLVASHLLTASEAFKIAEAAGVNTAQLIEAVNAGSGRSGVTLYNYPSRILNKGFDSGFTMQLMRKDVRLAIDMMAQAGLALPISSEVGAVWAASAASIDDAEDFNRIVELDTNNVDAKNAIAYG